MSAWEKYGDVLTNQMSSVGAGGYAIIGLRYSLPIHNGKSEELVQVTVYHNGSSVDSQQAGDTQLSGADTTEDEWEQWFSFDTKDWKTGTYSAQILVRDEITGKNSELEELAFDVVEPLTPNEVKLTGVQKPPTIRKGQPITFTLQFKNIGDDDNSIVSKPSIRHEQGEWQTPNDERVRLNIPAGESRSWESGEFSLNYTGTYEFRLDEIGITWNLTVTD
ncbi:hypothetical protein NDI76_05755 [Halogeometricum sp. S1BR25-6]|uniref:DUF11 domain-containing protein n=1 Tax=Halogeometricum salsisoli TaxID=2950536 RepID=A0ABU2GBR2_9EURY|nr:hypothetical protein [Halogeometricum sp. S1BR25-6]MDS0298240.1 hypothetical protein [Halogeometricum sp. S1BR25-6]